MSEKISNLKPLNPGERPPRGSGNMSIIHRCATEIVALQKSNLDFDRVAICQLLTDAFDHPQGQLTPQRLSNYLSAVLKNESQEVKEARTAQVEKLKGDIEQIKANLRIRAANYKKESLWSMTDRRQPHGIVEPHQNTNRSTSSAIEQKRPTPTQAVQSADRSAASTPQPIKPTPITAKPEVESQDGVITMPSKAPIRIQTMLGDFSRITGIQHELKQRVVMMNYISTNYDRLHELQLNQQKGDKAWRKELTDFSNSLQ
jgi:hypothetical protein